jgi:hypothetical protein
MNDTRDEKSPTLSTYGDFSPLVADRNDGTGYAAFAIILPNPIN